MDERQIQIAEKITRRVCLVIGFMGIFAVLWYFVPGETMKLIEVTRQFSTEDKCLDYLEQMRWPHGVGCVHCGSMSVSTITRTAGKNKRVRIYQCLEWGRVEGQRAKMGVELSRDQCRLSDYFEEVAGGTLLREQGKEGTIHRRERAPLVHD